MENATLEAFTSVLGSDAPAPGGGGAAALSGAMGAALCSMVANLTKGRKAYVEYQELAFSAADKAEELRKKLLAGIEKDKEVFLTVSAAYALPKGTEEEKAARSKAIQTALPACTESPLEVMRLSLEAVRLTASLLGKSSRGAVSDLGVSALCLKAASKSAWLNVLINLSSMEDKELAARYRKEGESLLSALETETDEIYSAVAALLDK